VFFGRVPAVHAVRQATLDAAYALHPNRFPNGPPKAALPPAEVHINPLEALVISVGHAETFASVNVDAPRFDDTPGSGPQKAPHATASTPRREALAAAAVAFSS
jgi:hypothetical protein